METILKDATRQMKKNNALLQKILQTKLDRKEKTEQAINKTKELMGDAVNLVKRCVPTITFDRK